jgi:hypothetical protein
MSASSTALRLVTLLFLLAGVLLLRKPVFGQANVTSPQIRVAHPFAASPRQGGVFASAGANRILFLTTLGEKQANSTHPLLN